MSDRPTGNVAAAGSPTLRQRFRRSLFYPLVFGGLTGLLAGSILSAFYLCAKIVFEVSAHLYGLLRVPEVSLWLAVPALVGAVLLGCLILATLQRLVPTARGSGIPLAEGGARGILRLKWLRTLSGLFAGSLVSFFCGLPLGGEGPSIGIGGMVGEGVGKVFRLPVPYRRYLVTGGACAGLAVAFNAPLTGLAFAFEETHRRFSVSMLMAALSAVVCANLVSRLTLGDFTPFSFLPYAEIPLSLLWVAALCGLVCGVVGVAFNAAVKRLTREMNRIRRPFWRLLPSFVLAGLCGALFFSAAGSGERLLAELSLSAEFWFLIVLLAVRFVTVVTAASSGATGGLFLPLLSLGGIVGFLCAKLLTLCGVPAATALTFVVLCCVCTFAASVRAPVTAIVLCFELTGDLAHLLPALTAVLFATAFAYLCKSRPLYDEMLERMIEHRREIATFGEYRLTGVVEPASIVCGKAIRDIFWPSNTFVTVLEREGKFLFPRADLVLLPGDRLQVRGECEGCELFRTQLEELLAIQSPAAPAAPTDEPAANFAAGADTPSMTATPGTLPVHAETPDGVEKAAGSSSIPDRTETADTHSTEAQDMASETTDTPSTAARDGAAETARGGKSPDKPPKSAS